MAAVQRVENDDAGKNYDPSSFKNSCPGTKTSDHIESDSVKAFQMMDCAFLGMMTLF